MMKSTVFSITFTLVSVITVAQHLKGRVRSAGDSTVVRECIVHNITLNRTTVADSAGNFVFNGVSSGTHRLQFNSIDFEQHEVSVYVASNESAFADVWLVPRNRVLNEVTVVGTSSGISGRATLNAVQGTGLYEAKKSEVILPGELAANLATNNPRQVYSRVPGLNIWENDGFGLQLSIGGRGLDPNRTSNFNVRQNGFDISADALGYPESYYTPPTEAVEQIQIVRGAASLQYGTQFGGLINFVMKEPASKPLEFTARASAGSYGFFNGFVSASGTAGKIGYYTFYQRKQGDGWRQNSAFDNQNMYATIHFQLAEKTKVKAEFTHMDYLSQQPGGLSMTMFQQNPRQSIRKRNWFEVDWNLLALHIDHRFSPTAEFNMRVFGLSAYRYSVGFRPNRVATIDDNSERDLIKGDFKNWGTEARFLKRYSLFKVPVVTLIGTRYYRGFNSGTQGLGSTGSDADFTYTTGESAITYDYDFLNNNIALFAENILYVTDNLSLTLGIRHEDIRTTADGYYGSVYRDLAGNIISVTKTEEIRSSNRGFRIIGAGISYRPHTRMDLYANISQNYRSITFSDMRISNPSAVVDPTLGDEKGFSFDLGARSEGTTNLVYDVSLFYVNYGNRIGEIQFVDDDNRIKRRRGNIGEAVTRGLEAYGEWDIVGQFVKTKNWKGTLFGNVALIDSRYTSSELPGVTGNEVEFVPAINLKCGPGLEYRSLRASFQVSHVSEQFTDATNAVDGGVAEVTGIIPAYTVMDLSVDYSWRQWRIETSVNNLADTRYFTRRATGYPGPGILPSDGRTFYATLQFKIGVPPKRD